MATLVSRFGRDGGAGETRHRTRVHASSTAPSHAPYAEVGIEPHRRSAMAFWESRVDGTAGGLPEPHASSPRRSSPRPARPVTSACTRRPRRVLRDALAVNPTDEGALLSLSGARAANHDFAGSMAIAEEVLTRNPQSKAAKAVIADDEFELGNYAEAETRARRARGQAPRQQRARRVGGPSSPRSMATTRRGALRRASAARGRRSRPPAVGGRVLPIPARVLPRPGRRRTAGARRARRGSARSIPTTSRRSSCSAKVLVSLDRCRAAARTSTRTSSARTPAADLHGELAKVYRALGRRRRRSGPESDAGLELRPRRPSASSLQSAGTSPASSLSSTRRPHSRRPQPTSRRATTSARTTRWRGPSTSTATTTTQPSTSSARGRPGARSAPLLYHAGMIEWKNGHDARARTAAERCPAARSELRSRAGTDRPGDVGEARPGPLNLGRLGGVGSIPR